MPRSRTVGRPSWRWPPRWSAGLTGGRPSSRTRSARWWEPCRRRPGSCLAGRRSGPGTSATRGRRCCARRAAMTRRSGAAVTAVRTGFSASPRTRTPTRSLWKCVMAGSTSSPTQARTAITASRNGVPTSGPQSRTTPSRWMVRTSQPTAAPFSGCGTRTRRCSEFRTSATQPSGSPSTTASRPCHIRSRTVAASAWTAPRVASTSSTRSTAAIMTCGWPFTWGRMSRPNSTSIARNCAGPMHLSQAPRGSSCLTACGGRCTAAKLTRSWAGTRTVWAAHAGGHARRQRQNGTRDAAVHAARVYRAQ